jgi:outer membrane usher protein
VALIRTLAAALVLMSATAAARAEPMLAEVRVNGADAGVMRLEREGPSLSAPASALRSLRLSLPGVDPAQIVRLDQLKGVRHAVDEAAQRVEIEADPQALEETRLGAKRLAYQPPDQPGWGATLNYAVFAQSAPGDVRFASAAGEARVFGPRGVLTQSFLARSNGERTQLRRLETSYVAEDYARARRLILGDFVSAGNDWSPAVRAAGIRYTTDRSLRPDIISRPVLEVRGAAATPSTLELYVDGVRRLQSRAPAGPFTIDAGAVVDGRGRVQVVATDALGRQTVQSLAFYGASELSAPGRLDFSLEAGALRDNFAGEDDRYSDAYVGVALRRGLTTAVTVEGRASGRTDLQTVGMAGTATLRGEGLITAAASGSSNNGRTGGQAYLSLSRETAATGLYVTWQVRTDDFRDLADQPGSARLRTALQAGANLRHDLWGAFSVSYSRLEQERGGHDIAAIGWSQSFGPVSTRVGGYISDHGESRVQFGFSMPLGRGRSASLEAASTRRGGRLYGVVSAAPPLPSGWGWRASSERRESRVEAEVRRTSLIGEVGAAVAVDRRGTAVQAFGSGAMVWIGGRPMLSARLGEAFAVVETGAPGVPIKVENRPAGRTNRAGRLLVADLPAQAASRVDLQVEAVALDHDVPRPTAVVRPPRGTGIVVRLPVRRASAILARFVQPDGAPVPPGLNITIDGRRRGLTGFDGLAYLTGVERRAQVEISGSPGVCRVTVEHDPTAAPGQVQGPLVCRFSPGLLGAPGVVADADVGGDELHR